MGLPIIFFAETKYFWICECLQAICSSTACASLTSCFCSKWRPSIFDSWCCSLLYVQWSQPHCWKAIVNWNWVDIFVILFQIALQFNPFTVCYIGKCSTAQSLESSIMFSSSHILSWNLKIYIWKDKNCKRKLDTWTDETVRIANFNEHFFFLVGRWDFRRRLFQATPSLF